MKRRRLAPSDLSIRSLMIPAATAGLGMLENGAAHGFDYELVAGDDAGNAPGSYGYGAVAYDFRIGTYEVTIGQYTTFLNAVAASDPYALYHSRMGTDANSAGIMRSGEDGSYHYSVIDNFGDSGNRPITYVSWFDAAGPRWRRRAWILHVRHAERCDPG